jgi:hypothetical protein
MSTYKKPQPTIAQALIIVATAAALIFACLSGKAAAPAPTAISSCMDFTKSGSYVLTQNVSSPGTCFFVDASNVTLNLGGFTVTYGTAGGTEATPGVALIDDWYSQYGLAKSGSTTSHGGFTMYGGSVIASVDAAPHSSAVWAAGNASDISPAPVIHDTVLTTYAEDASPIFGDGTESGWQLYNNTIAYDSLTTSNRYYFYGYAIWLGNATAGTVPDQIYSNKIVAAPQGGITDNHPGAVIGPSNDIAFNSFYANDYCVLEYTGTGQIIKNNYCHPASGRGIDVESNNVQVLGNTVIVTELPQDAEYNGCEGGGADGIRVRDNYDGTDQMTRPVGVLIQGNKVTANAVECQAQALQLTQLAAGDSITLLSNVMKSTGPGSESVPDSVLSFDGSFDATLALNTNSGWSSNLAWIRVEWDGATMVIPTLSPWAGMPKYFADDQDGGIPGEALVIGRAGAPSSSSVSCGNSADGPVTVGKTLTMCGSQNAQTAVVHEHNRDIDSAL